MSILCKFMYSILTCAWVHVHRTEISTRGECFSTFLLQGAVTSTSFPKKSSCYRQLNKTVTLVTVVEVRCNACLHDPRHVPYWCKAAGASREKRQNRKTPPLPVQPRNDMSSKCLACWDSNSIQQSQSLAEQTAERHVPLLQTPLCRGNKRRKW